MDPAIQDTITRLGAALAARGWFLATAESCTGGLIAAALTDVPGSSDWFRGAVVAYANSVKSDLLGVPEALLVEHGAVSEPVACRMAEGAARALNTRCAVAVSGIAGPGGGTPDKPVGTVWMAFTIGSGVQGRLFHFDGTRAEVRAKAVRSAVQGLLALLDGTGQG